MYRPGFVGNQGTQEWTDLLNVTILFEFRLYLDDAKIHPVESPDFESTTIMVDYGEGGPHLRLHSSLFYHTYSRIGTYNFLLSVNNSVSLVEFNGRVHITSCECTLSSIHSQYVSGYCIAGNYCGTKFSRMAPKMKIHG